MAEQLFRSAVGTIFGFILSVTSGMESQWGGSLAMFQSETRFLD
jgi:hypothetical protein